MKNKTKDDYKIPFKGTMLSKTEGKRAFVAFLFAAAGAVLSALTFGIQNKLAVFSICLVLALIGFGLAITIIKK